MGRMRKSIFGPALALGLLGFSNVTAAAPKDPDIDDGRWHFALTPYLWLPAVKGSVSPTVYGLRSATGPDGRPVTGISRDATINISSVVWTLGGGYSLLRGPSGNLDLIAGARYLSMSSDLTLSLQGPGGLSTPSHKVSLDASEWDGIIGARGQVLFPGTRWFIPYYIDVGTGSSNWTWQGILGAGYRFDWGDVTLALRSLSYDFDKDDADIRFTGPGLGVGFRW